MSLQDLQSGTFSTKQLVDQIQSEAKDLLDPEADKKAGRLDLEARKVWLLNAIGEYVRLRTNAGS